MKEGEKEGNEGRRRRKVVEEGDEGRRKVMKEGRKVEEGRTEH